MAQPPPGWNFPSNNMLAQEIAWSSQAPIHQQIPPPAPTGIYAPSADYPPLPQPGSYPPPYASAYAPPSAPMYGAPGTGNPTWVSARAGEVPPTAVVGGYDNNEQMYVGRADHQGSLLPGKVVPSHGVCYVAWGGYEHAKVDYQVLCGCQAMWVPCAGDVPPDALPSGETENGEPLFVGRAQHNGSVTIGKVQESHRACYIPYGGREIGYSQYEVLVAK